jgi:hypothetical protein
MGDDYYSPNQQVVRSDGSGAAEEGTGGEPGKRDTPKPRQSRAKAGKAAAGEPDEDTGED